MFNFSRGLYCILVGYSIFISMAAHSAVTLDRTRIIFPGTEKSINITISNDNPEEAYLAQSWIEDLQGNKLTKGAILATPPLQRIEPNSYSLVRLSTTPELHKLPQDRESVFYFNLREVPPKSTDGNTLQIALQSRVKLFYRPNSILSEAETKWTHKVTLTKTAQGYRVNNITPFNLTIIGFGNSKAAAEKILLMLSWCHLNRLMILRLLYYLHLILLILMIMVVNHRWYFVAKVIPVW